MTPLTVGLLGAGRMGAEHAAAVAACGDHVRWVADSDARSADRLAARIGADVVDDVEALLAAEPDAIVIATPSDLHLAQALRCAGVPTLLEKPPWLAHQDPTPLLQAADRLGALTAVGMTTRFDPAIRTVEHAVRTGRIGEVLSIDDTINFVLDDDSLPAWYHRDHHEGGGIVQTNGVHAIDRVCWILGETPRLVSARAGSTFRSRPIEDNATISLSTDAASITVNLLWSRFPPPPSRMLVIGTRGTATAFADGSWEITTADTTEHGPADPARNNYVTQWQAFRRAADECRRRPPDATVASGPIPTATDLAPPMRLLAEIVALVG